MPALASTTPALGIALVEAGIRPKSQPHQVWLWLKDHPRSTAKVVAATLTNIPLGSISSVLAQLTARKMVSATREYCDHAKREMIFYSALGKTYELLPDVRAKPMAKAPPPALVTVPVRPGIQEMTDRLTIAEARAVYAVLHKMFGQA